MNLVNCYLVKKKLKDFFTACTEELLTFMLFILGNCMATVHPNTCTYDVEHTDKTWHQHRAIQKVPMAHDSLSGSGCGVDWIPEGNRHSNLIPTPLFWARVLQISQRW